MLFENLHQFEKAKSVLLESEYDVDAAASILKKDNDFKFLSESQIRESLVVINEGFGEKITNFLSDSFGGDIRHLKTVLTQMKEQELKFNREEKEIYNSFYNILQDQKALDKDKKNPSYESLSKELNQAKASLNNRMKELTKTHNEIFDALEEKVKSLVGDSNRKKKYFNAQRAADVLETKNDRYEKIKSITAKSTQRSKDLEQFFGVSTEGLEKEKEKAEKAAQKAVKDLPKETEKSGDVDAIKGELEVFEERFEDIKKSVGGFFAKRKDIKTLQDELINYMSNDDFLDLPQNKQKKVVNLHLAIDEYLDKLEDESKKIK